MIISGDVVTQLAGKMATMPGFAAQKRIAFLNSIAANSFGIGITRKSTRFGLEAIMAKYIMSNRNAGKKTNDQRKASLESVNLSFKQLTSDIDVVADRHKSKTSRRTIIFNADPSHIESRRKAFGPDVIIEPEFIHEKMVDNLPYDLMKAVPLDLVRAFGRPAADPQYLGEGEACTVTVRGEGTPLRGAEVHLFLSGPGDLSERLERRTDKNGEAQFRFADFFEIVGLIVSPYGGYWPKVVRGGDRSIDVDCRPLPKDGPVDWWHRVMATSYDLTNGVCPDGNPLKIGVIDSGMGPHAALDETQHVENCGAIIDGKEYTALKDGYDSGSHGTHVCGIIAGRLPSGDCYGGLAPGARVYSVRVFPSAGGANQGDIADAIDLLSDEKQVDVVNLSLGSTQASQIMRDAIIDALERGTICVCAAANSAGPVQYPAAFPETIAISAFGKLGWVPQDSTTALPTDDNLYGRNQTYAANFTCFGDEIVCCGSGVGIISAVPTRHGYDSPYAAMNGTSMAAPAVTAAMANLLSKDSAYCAMERNKARSKYALAKLIASCSNLGLPRDYQGWGVPTTS